MIGLILKDLLIAKKQLLIASAIMIFYCVVLGMERSQDYQIGMFSGYLVAIMAILPVSMLAYDEKNKWGKYASALPVTRSQQVMSKYVVMILLTLAAIFIFSLASLAAGIDFGEIVSQLAVTFSTSIIVSSVLLTLGYKFGYEKARFIFVGIIFVTMFVATRFISGGDQLGQLDQFVKPHGFEIMSIVCGLLVYIACCCISIHLFSKKDL